MYRASHIMSNMLEACVWSLNMLEAVALPTIDDGVCRESVVLTEYR
jgi:hypothetical protein